MRQATSPFKSSPTSKPLLLLVSLPVISKSCPTFEVLAIGPLCSCNLTPGQLSLQVPPVHSALQFTKPLHIHGVTQSIK